MHQSEFKFTKKLASSLIVVSYQKFGTAGEISGLNNSILEEEIGAVDGVTNEGYFRLLDEAIYLFRILSLYSYAKIGFDSKSISISTLVYAICETATAIRILEANGLDSAARQNLRNLNEQANCLIACLFDEEFGNQFTSSTDFKSSNEFWHEYISKGKLRKLLVNLAKSRGKQIEILIGDESEQFTEILGPSAHPSMLGFAFGHTGFFQDDSNHGQRMLQLTAARSSNFVLMHSSRILLACMAVCTEEMKKGTPLLGLLKENPLFNHLEADADQVAMIGKVSALIFLMLAKAHNRTKEGFDPLVHY